MGGAALKLKVGDGADGGSSRALSSSINSDSLSSFTFTLKLAGSSAADSADVGCKVVADVDDGVVVVSGAEVVEDNVVDSGNVVDVGAEIVSGTSVNILALVMVIDSVSASVVVILLFLFTGSTSFSSSVSLIS